MPRLATPAPNRAANWLSAQPVMFSKRFFSRYKYLQARIVGRASNAKTPRYNFF